MTARILAVAAFVIAIVSAATADTTYINPKNIGTEGAMYALGLWTVDREAANWFRRECPNLASAFAAVPAPPLPAGIESVNPSWDGVHRDSLIAQGTAEALDALRKAVSEVDVVPAQIMIKDDQMDLTPGQAKDLGLSPSASPIIVEMPSDAQTIEKARGILRSHPGRVINRPIITTLSYEPAYLHLFIPYKFVDHSQLQLEDTVYIFMLPWSNHDGMLTIDLRALAWRGSEVRCDASPAFSLKRTVKDGGTIYLAATGLRPHVTTLITLTVKRVEKTPS